MFCANIYGPLDGYTTALPLEVITQRNSVADFIRLQLNLIQKENKKLLFEPTFGGLRGNVRTPYGLLERLWLTSYSS